MIDDRDPIVIADVGPLVRLAAAGLLDTMRLTGRRIVIPDMVEEEALAGRPNKPCAPEISAWILSMGDAIERPVTREGVYIGALRTQAETPEGAAALKKALRSSGERAIRDYIEDIDPDTVDEILVLHEGPRVQTLMRASQAPVHLMTTRAFVKMVAPLGVGADAVAALKAIESIYDVQPSIDTRLRPFGSLDDEDDDPSPS